jgi:hypothetical protein
VDRLQVLGCSNPRPCCLPSSCQLAQVNTGRQRWIALAHAAVKRLKRGITNVLLGLNMY